MKKVMGLLVVFCMLLSLAACGQSESSSTTTSAAPDSTSLPATGEDPSGKTVGFSVNALDENQSVVVAEFEKTVTAAGYEVIVLNADNSVDKQISDVESLIARQVDLIVLQALDSNALAPVADDAMAEGIMVMDVTFGVETACTLHVAYDFFIFTTYQAEFCKQWMDEHPDETLRIGYLHGSQGTQLTDKLYNGFYQTLSEDSAYEGRWEILAEKVVDWDANKSIDTVEDWLQAFPEMNAIISMSDTMTMAAVQALKAADQDLSQWVTIGKDGSSEAIASIEANEMTATVYAPLAEYAQEVGGKAIALLDGTLVTTPGDEYNISTFILVTKENAAEYGGY